MRDPELVFISIAELVRSIGFAEGVVTGGVLLAVALYGFVYLAHVVAFGLYMRLRRRFPRLGDVTL